MPIADGSAEIVMDGATESSASAPAALRRVLWCLLPATTAAFATFNGVAQILTFLGRAMLLLSFNMKESAGRDMGIMNMAYLSQLIAPAIAGALILRFGYPSLFALCMVAAAIGGVLVFRIRGVR
jgi:hypothetical protein